ncbi:MAG TPA: aminotransferase class I/II-fold pyridoxal phosphate-dependent enzyme, partial [bacterium]|nr:aminotransferase class I/II-fold pyridoxal phosphate-dependent enzyme [bacterium]
MKEFLSYGKQWIDDSDIKAVVDVLKGDYLTQGPAIDKFEQKICQITGAKYCVAVSNGTAALHIAVKVLGIEEGKEGITSPNTFLATCNALVYNRLKPVFADIDEKTYCIDPKQIEKIINQKTKVVLPVHFAGQPADMSTIYDLCKKEGIYIIEDAAHAIGSKYKCGAMVGGCKYSDMTILSFHPVKTITTAEGGAITTNSEKLYEKLKVLRTHGITKDPTHMTHNPGPWYYEMHDLGFNYRLTDIQAVLGTSQLCRLDDFVKRRREIVKQYNEAFSKIEWLTTPYEDPKAFSAFHLYVLKFDFNKLGKTR